MAITTRPITEDEVLEFRERIFAGFGHDLGEKDRDPERFLTLVPMDRTIAAFDGDRIVGTLSAYPLEVTVPGGASVPMAGTTTVTVENTHRRQGVLRAMMADHLDDTAARGEALAGLWASETPIYARFGFGHATSRDVVDATTDALTLTADSEGTVRLIDPQQAPELLPVLYDDVRRTRPGMLSRSADWWKHDVIYDPDYRRRDKTKMRFVVFEAGDGLEGYAIYRQKEKWADLVATGEVTVIEVVAATDRAHAGLWHYLANIDLFPRITYWNMPADDPLWWKLRDPRQAERKRTDALWIRIMDVPAALEARGYETDGSIRLGVDDPFRPETSGVYELAASDGEGKSVVVDAEPDVTLGSDSLGALFLGGSSAVAMAAAGLIDGTPAAVATLHRLFHTDIAPWCDSIF